MTTAQGQICGHTGITDEQFEQFFTGDQTNITTNLTFGYDARMIQAIWYYFRLNHAIGQSLGNLADVQESYAKICEKYEFTNEFVAKIVADNPVILHQCYYSPHHQNDNV